MTKAGCFYTAIVLLLPSGFQQRAAAESTALEAKGIPDPATGSAMFPDNDDDPLGDIRGESDSRTSEIHRLEKRHSLGIVPFGQYGGLEGRALEYGYYVDHNSVVEINSASAQMDNHSLFIPKIRIQTLSLKLKLYWFNSFYTNSGVAFRQLRIHYGSKEDDLTGLDAEFKGHKKLVDLSLDIAVGNRWQWENFALGFDWLGAFMPVYTVKEEDEIDEDFSDEALRTARKKTRGIDDFTLQYLIFFLGASF